MAVEGETIKRPVGRPPKLTPEERAEVYEAFRLYIERTPDPTIVGFVSWDNVPISYDVTDDNLVDWAEFSILRKRAIKKQEAFLLEAAGQGRYNATMAIFRLKQPTHGYKDRTEQDITTDGQPLPTMVQFIHDKTTTHDTDTSGV